MNEAIPTPTASPVEVITPVETPKPLSVDELGGYVEDNPDDLNDIEMRSKIDAELAVMAEVNESELSEIGMEDENAEPEVEEVPADDFAVDEEVEAEDLQQAPEEELISPTEIPFTWDESGDIKLESVVADIADVLGEDYQELLSSLDIDDFAGLDEVEMYMKILTTRPHLIPKLIMAAGPEGIKNIISELQRRVELNPGASYAGIVRVLASPTNALLLEAAPRSLLFPKLFEEDLVSFINSVSNSEASELENLINEADLGEREVMLTVDWSSPQAVELFFLIKNTLLAVLDAAGEAEVLACLEELRSNVAEIQPSIPDFSLRIGNYVLSAEAGVQEITEVA